MTLVAEAERPIPNEPEPAIWEESPPKYARATSRIPPHDLGAERALLGVMLLDPKATAAGITHCTPEQFYKPVHGHVFASIAALYARQATADVHGVAAELRRSGLLESVGGPSALTDILGAAGFRSEVEHYATLVVQAARARQVIAMATGLTEAGYAGDLERAVALHQSFGDVLEGAAGETRLHWEDVAAVLRGEVDDLVPTMLRRDDGACLAYPGLLHWLMGPPGVGKSWVALYVVAESLQRGAHVGYLDWESNRVVIGGRLRALGCTAEQVEAQFHYLRPPPITRIDSAALVAFLAEEHHSELCICDGVAKALARQGFDEDKAGPVLAWLELVVSPLTDAGVAVLCLDHVTKDKESQGLYARGSGAKLGEVSGAAWTVRAKQGFSRYQGGRIELVQAKDREGHNATDGAVVAFVDFEPEDDGLRLHVHVRAPRATEVTKSGKPRRTLYMQRVVDKLEKMREPQTPRWVERNTTGKGEYIREAIAALVEDEVLRPEHVGGQVVLRVIRTFSETGDPGPDEPYEDDEEEMEYHEPF
jgi:hypothetical protein